MGLLAKIVCGIRSRGPDRRCRASSEADFRAEDCAIVSCNRSLSLVMIDICSLVDLLALSLLQEITRDGHLLAPGAFADRLPIAVVLDPPNGAFTEMTVFVFPFAFIN